MPRHWQSYRRRAVRRRRGKRRFSKYRAKRRAIRRPGRTIGRALNRRRPKRRFRRRNHHSVKMACRLFRPILKCFEKESVQKHYGEMRFINASNGPSSTQKFFPKTVPVDYDNVRIYFMPGVLVDNTAGWQTAMHASMLTTSPSTDGVRNFGESLSSDTSLANNMACVLSAGPSLVYDTGANTVTNTTDSIQNVITRIHDRTRWVIRYPQYFSATIATFSLAMQARKHVKVKMHEVYLVFDSASQVNLLLNYDAAASTTALYQTLCNEFDPVVLGWVANPADATPTQMGVNTAAASIARTEPVDDSWYYNASPLFIKSNFSGYRPRIADQATGFKDGLNRHIWKHKYVVTHDISPGPARNPRYMDSSTVSVNWFAETDRSFFTGFDTKKMPKALRGMRRHILGKTELSNTSNDHFEATSRLARQCYIKVCFMTIHDPYSYFTTYSGASNVHLYPLTHNYRCWFHPST